MIGVRQTRFMMIVNNSVRGLYRREPITWRHSAVFNAEIWWLALTHCVSRNSAASLFL